MVLAVCRFLKWLEKQPLQGEITELSAAQKLYEFRKEGEHFQDLSFGTISGFGLLWSHYPLSSDVEL